MCEDLGEGGRDQAEGQQLREFELETAKKAQKKKRRRRHDSSEDCTSDSSSSSSEDSSEDEGQCNVAALVGNTLSKILQHNVMRCRMRPVAGSDYMSLTVNKLLQRNDKIVRDLQKLKGRSGLENLARATLMVEEHKRNKEELDLLERGLEEAKTDPVFARETVLLVTKERLRVSSENKEWEKARKKLCRDDKTKLTHRMLYSGDGEAQEDK